MPISTKGKAEQKSPRVSKKPNKSKESSQKSGQPSTQSTKQHLSSTGHRSLQEGLALATLSIQPLKQSRGSTKANVRNGKETQPGSRRKKSDTQLISVCEAGFSDESKKSCAFCGHEVSKHPGSKTFTIDGIPTSSRNSRLPKDVLQQYMEAAEYMRKMTVQLKQLTELMQAEFM